MLSNFGLPGNFLGLPQRQYSRDGMAWNGMPREQRCESTGRERSTTSQRAPGSIDFPPGFSGLLLNAYKINENPAIVSAGLCTGGS